MSCIITGGFFRQELIFFLLIQMLYYRIMKSKQTTKSYLLPRIEISRINVILFIVGIIVLIVGFKLVAISPWDNPLSRSVAPVVLLIGYVVIFPLAIMLRSKKSPKDQK